MMKDIKREQVLPKRKLHKTLSELKLEKKEVRDEIEYEKEEYTMAYESD